MFDQFEAAGAGGVTMEQFGVWLKVVRRKQGKDEASEKRVRPRFRKLLIICHSLTLH